MIEPPLLRRREGARRNPPHVQSFIDRNGSARFYYRRPGFPRVPLPGLPWSPTFMAAYEKAASGERLEIAAAKTIPGSVSALAVSFYRSADFTGLGDSTKRTYRGIIERFRAEHGAKRVAHLERRHLQKIVSDRADTPAAANNMLRVIHLLMRHAIERGWRGDDPTQGVRRVRHKSAGFPTWEEEHIAAFLAHHKPGSRAHLALSLLLYTGQRRSDVVRMGRKDLRDNVLHVIQKKTGQHVHIPLHPKLAEVLNGLPETPAFLMTAQGKPFTAPGFTNWFRAMVVEVTVNEGGPMKRALPDGLSPHGLRKATCRRLAEAGCTPHEIMAISGHKSLAEVTRYTVAASRKNLAQRAIAALEPTKTETAVVKPTMIV